MIRFAAVAAMTCSVGVLATIPCMAKLATINSQAIAVKTFYVVERAMIECMGGWALIPAMVA
jgi:hypothetical protein